MKSDGNVSFKFQVLSLKLAQKSTKSDGSAEQKSEI
jgi:hypothetical protein